MCNCEFCEPCAVCGHKADEHIAGDGSCFRCSCPSFNGVMNKKLVEFGFIMPEHADKYKVAK